jgi:hypothetical protein
MRCVFRDAEPSSQLIWTAVIWSARIENAIQFSCFDDANVQKDVVADETEVIRVNDKWYVVKR